MDCKYSSRIIWNSFCIKMVEEGIYDVIIYDHLLLYCIVCYQSFDYILIELISGREQQIFRK